MTENNRSKEESKDKLDLLINLPTTSSNAFTTYKALKADNVDKTEHLLLKAKRLDPSIDVKQYLKDMRDARARNTILNGNAVPKKKSGQTEHNIDDANTYLQIAENAITDTNYEWAVTFLDKFDALYTSERSVKLRKQLEKRSYYDGNLGNARRLLKLAELLFPTKRAKNECEIARLDYDNYYKGPGCTESVEKENTIEFFVKNEVQRLINSGLDNMKKQKYDHAEVAFQRAQYLEPNKTYTDKLISDVQTKKKEIKVEPSREKSPSPPIVRNVSLRQYREIKKEEKESNYITGDNDYTRWGLDAFYNEDFENAETFLRLAEVFQFTEDTREFFVMIAKAKIDFDFCSVVKESKDNHLRQAEKAFIKGMMSEAWHLINKPNVEPSPYVTELKQKIYMMSPRNNFWIKILGGVFEKKKKRSSSYSSSSEEPPY